MKFAVPPVCCCALLKQHSLLTQYITLPNLYCKMDRKSRDRKRADRLPEIVLVCSRDQASDSGACAKLQFEIDQLKIQLEAATTKALKADVKQNILILLNYVETLTGDPFDKTWIKDLRVQLGGGAIVDDLKAEIARQLWEEDGFYRILNNYDNEVKKAVSFLKR